MTDRRTHDETYVQRLASHRVIAPGAPAARGHGLELTYGELSERANRLAHYLQSLGVGPEVLVGICLDRSLENLVTMLAIWKARGAFLQLPTDYPGERLNYMISDSGAKFLITQRKFLDQFTQGEAKILCLDELRLEQVPADDQQIAGEGAELAYVIYTSGSTGKPKAVEIVQRSLVNHSLSIASVYGLRAEDKVLQFASLGFDVMLEEIFPTWLAGAEVILRMESLLTSIPEFLKFVADENISVLNLPTALWHDLVDYLAQFPLPASVRLVVIGGERASTQAFMKWKQVVPRSVQLINSYGPSECTITSTCFIADIGQDSLPIGRPIANMCAVVLDATQRPVESGAVGELYLGGLGVARGYRGRPELTARAFIPNTFRTGIPADRLYKTGDLVRCREDGNLEFVGRVDEQVKIRGFRIEPGEVEAAMLQCPQVQAAAVMPRQHSTGRNRLVAYYVPRRANSGCDSEIRAFLVSRLPTYMIPSAFVSLKALPLAATGKIDRHALPEPAENGDDEQKEAVAPRNEIETRLADIWQEVLRVKNVGVQDDFFALGGDSLLAMQIFTRVRDLFATEPSWVQFFETPTIAALATSLTGQPSIPQLENVAPIPIPRDQPLPASFVQESLWLLQQLAPESDAYNMGWCFRCRGDFDTAALTRALNAVGNRHEIFRTSLQYQDGKLFQVIAPVIDFKCGVVDLTLLPASQREADLRRHLGRQIQAPFDLATAPLLRANVFHLTQSEHVLCLVLHHAISDGWSMSLLAEELARTYEAFTSQSAIPQIVSPQLEYADYAAWQRRVFQGERLDRELRFWRENLKGALSKILLPHHSPKARGQEKKANRSTLDLPGRLAGAAQAVAQAHRATPFMVLLTALALALQRVTGQSDLVIGTVVAGRNHQKFETTLGCFMNFIPLRIRIAAGATPQLVLTHVRRVVLEAQAHQECPFEKLVADLCPKRNGDSNPVFNVAMLWHNYPKRKSGWGDRLSARSFVLSQRTALLDLRFEAEPVDEKWSLSCEYNQGLFSEQQITALLGEVSASLENLAKSTIGHLNARDSFPGIKSWFHRLWPRSRDKAA